MTIRAFIAVIQGHPKLTAWIGALFGWVSFDALRVAQIGAALLAGLVSLCALILTAPKAIREVRSWFAR